MNIDVYIQMLKLHCNNLDHEEMDGIANWLEELKTLRMTDRECVYHKAYEQGKADERAKVIKEMKNLIIDTPCKMVINEQDYFSVSELSIMLEQLKEQSNE